jgi:hypothetical protein
MAFAWVDDVFKTDFAENARISAQHDTAILAWLRSWSMACDLCVRM